MSHPSPSPPDAPRPPDVEPLAVPPSEPVEENSAPLPSGPTSADESAPLVGGKYRLRRMLGEGGMGAVYEARHEELGKRLAVKLMRGSAGQQPEVASRFRREARATSLLESDHIVQVFDAGYDEQQGLYMAMEFLRGCDLATALKRVGRLDIRAACALVAQVAVGLAVAHEAGVVHRDLKPANLFLVPRSDGSLLVKILDFGIAKVMDDSNRDARTPLGITGRGAVLGTPQYMSPEQIQGLPDIDARADIYALATVLYECLTGKPMVPMLATYELIIVHIMTRTPEPLWMHCPGLPPSLDQLFSRMVSRDPGQRPASMAEVLDALLAAMPGLDIAPLRIGGLELETPRSGPRSFPRPSLPSQGSLRSHPDLAETVEARLPLRRPSAWALTLGSLALLLVGAVGLWVATRPDPPAPSPLVHPVLSSPPSPSLEPPPVVVPVELAAPTSSLVPVRPPPSARSGRPAARPSASAEPPLERKIGGAGLSTAF